MVTALVMLLAVAAHADWKADACKKACIPAHDAKVIACKTVETKEGEACVRRADQERKDCEAACDHPKKKPAKKKPARRGGGPGKV